MENTEVNNTFTLFSSVCLRSAGIRPTSLLQNTCEAEQFNRDLQQAKLKHQHRTSSPDVFKSFVLNSVPTDSSELQSCQVDIPLEVKGESLLTRSRLTANKCCFSRKKQTYFSIYVELCNCRSRKDPGRDRLPAGQKDTVSHLPGP